MARGSYITLKACVVFVVTVHNNLHYKSSLLLPQACKRESVVEFIYMAAIILQPAPWKEAIIIFFPLQPLQWTLMQILILRSHYKKLAFLSNFHLSL